MKAVQKEYRVTMEERICERGSKRMELLADGYEDEVLDEDLAEISDCM